MQVWVTSLLGGAVIQAKRGVFPVERPLTKKEILRFAQDDDSR